MASTRSGFLPFLAMQRVREGCALPRLPFSVFFAATIHVVQVRFIEDEDILTDLVHLEKDVLVGKEMPSACV